jgi:CHRD domain
MMKLATALLSLLAIVSFAGASAVGATNEVKIAMQAQNGSGEEGSATLTQDGADVKVVISLKNAPATAQPAHIHDGTCADLKGVVHPLTNVVSGSSTTVVKGVTIDSLLKGTFAINVHESASNLGKYVSCGNIKASGAM